MNMDPYSFVADELLGKSREEALKAIRALRREIARLRKQNEERESPDEVIIHPKLNVYRDYLAAAREFFEEQGWEYEPSKEELADMEFNDRLKDVKSIEIEYGGYFCGGENRKITFEDDKIIVKRSFWPGDPDADELNRVFFEGMVKDDLLAEIAAIHLGEWKEYYDSDILDGVQWSVIFRYSDRKKKEFGGSNRFPPDFFKFLAIMEMDGIGR